MCLLKQVVQVIKLWDLNKEFDISIINDGTKYPSLTMWKKDKSSGFIKSLKDKSISEVMNEANDYWPESDFLKQLCD